nr:PREDICTED: uncharacterized protein LOC109438633 isoform X2 [Rhinolophus sinicus]
MVTMHGSYPTLWSPEDLLLGPTTRLKPAWPEQRQSLTGGAQTGPEHNSWFLTHSPLPVTLLFVFCLLLGVADPHIMSQLEPLRLTGSLATYNLGLAVLSGYISYEFVATLLLANSSYFCQPTDCSPASAPPGSLLNMQKRMSHRQRAEEESAFQQTRSQVILILLRLRGCSLGAFGESFCYHSNSSSPLSCVNRRLPADRWRACADNASSQRPLSCLTHPGFAQEAAAEADVRAKPWSQYLVEEGRSPMQLLSATGSHGPPHFTHALA